MKSVLHGTAHGLHCWINKIFYIYRWDLIIDNPDLTWDGKNRWVTTHSSEGHLNAGAGLWAAITEWVTGAGESKTEQLKAVGRKKKIPLFACKVTFCKAAFINRSKLCTFLEISALASTKTNPTRAINPKKLRLASNRDGILEMGKNYLQLQERIPNHQQEAGK